MRIRQELLSATNTDSALAATSERFPIEVDSVQERLNAIHMRFAEHATEEERKRQYVAELEATIAREAHVVHAFSTKGFVQPPPSPREVRPTPTAEPAGLPAVRYPRIKAPLPMASRGVLAKRSSSAPPARRRPSVGGSPEQHASHGSPRLSDAETPYIRRFGPPDELVRKSVRDAKRGRRGQLFQHGLMSAGVMLG